LARVELRGVAKVYPGGIEAIRPLDLTIDEGELFVVVGPSGSGKSTLLRLIAGLESPSAGSLWIDGRRADGLAAHDRDVAMVFQTPVVYPFLSVFENLAFGLRARGRARRDRETHAEQRARIEGAVKETAAVLGLADMLGRRPGTLSGGQRQRVALGRALVRRPRILLLDEPFASLDAPLRVALRTELLDLHRRLGTTMVHVTHDQAEAMVLGRRIAVLRKGRTVQSGAPLDVYERPACRFVGEFVGSPPMNILPCVVETLGPPAIQVRLAESAGGWAWTIDAGATRAGPLLRRGPGPVDLGVRAEHIHAVASPDPASLVARGEVRRLEPHGAETVATLALGRHDLSLRLPGRTAIGVGAPVQVALDPAGIVWFDPESGLALD
jgi:ABC-type sugar transport system ATPase subunit